MMEDSALIQEFEENDLILTSHGLKRLKEDQLDINQVIEEAQKRNVWLVSDEFLVEFIEDKDREKDTSLKWSHKCPSKEVDPELNIREDFDVTERSTCEGKIEDFLEYFNNKFDNLKDILRDRPNMKGTLSINVLKERGNVNAQFIGMVADKFESRNRYKFLDMEDPTDSIRVLIPKDNERLLKLWESILPDEVIGLEGRLYNDLFIANGIYQPNLPVNNQTNHAEEDVAVALLSDLHVGSHLFLEKEFKNFIECLKKEGRGDNGELFGRIKYLFIAGDSVDGIGIYPGQEKELGIPDIYKQYDFVASLLSEVPNHIQVVLGMGNHDAVRLAEPQPRLAEDLAGELDECGNVHVCGNPVMVEAHGVKTLMYHGTSMDGVIGNLPQCNYKNPETAMVEYLKRRYLVPSYGQDNIAPEKEDYLIIDEIPDIFHCGHVHTNGYTSYRGVKVINSGTFQARTKFQEQMGHIPTPGRVPIVNLYNQEVSVAHFYDEPDKK